MDDFSLITLHVFRSTILKVNQPTKSVARRHARPQALSRLSDWLSSHCVQFRAVSRRREIAILVPNQ